ncbi:serine/threonine-protein kinase CDG1 isoform X3 [Medicago truncatula]|uniref:serine/threonine-protein kinase CDG1 isoform X3 n=1 Tax=Medicago truncatula TaxID=3880 RepID=UPI00196819E2|nr:serine/threonine-protein kinase CDG1 isoform X3 [Medicago truncatula]
MTVKERCVLVGIRIDRHGSRQLLNWAIAKVAQPRDYVIAIHVVTTPDHVSESKALVDDYLEVYQGLCDAKKVSLSGHILTGTTFRNILIREAKNRAAIALVVGGGASTAKYCAKRLPGSTNVIGIQGARIVFQRCTDNKQLIEDPRPSLISTVVQSASGTDHSENEDEKSKSQEGNRKWEEETFKGEMKVSSRLSTSQKLGWPLLRRMHTEISRDMSVVQWVMNLPDRSTHKYNNNRHSSSQIEGQSYKNVISFSSCKWFIFEVLNSCTCQFSSENVIGIGGSNRVYRGTLPDGKPVAIKVMQSSKEAFKDFALEVEIMSSLNHPRIAPLLGICIRDETLISVYDYFPQGTLDQNLRGKNKDESMLTWEDRFKVAVGIGEALNYLHKHNQTSKPIIHRDVKSSNILLSEGFEPHLSDFGLAMWGPTTSSFVIQDDVVGTFGYLAPEYFMYGKVSDKIDVYAFGVVLLELISGREPIDSETCEGHEISLVTWAKPILESGDVKSLLDPKLQGKFDVAQMHRMVLAASLCITRAARLRPNMNQILKILNGCDEKVENMFKSEESDHDHSENLDDEVYPNSSAELHLSLALLDVDNDTASSYSSISINEYLKEHWSRSSSFN